MSQPHESAENAADRQAIENKSGEERIGERSRRILAHVIFRLLEDLLELILCVAKAALRDVLRCS